MSTPTCTARKSGRRSSRYILLGFGMPCRRQCETACGVTSNRRAAATVPPNASIKPESTPADSSNMHASVSQLTVPVQGGLHAARYGAVVNTELLTTAERVRLAIAQSGSKLVPLAEAIGCTHATLSQWQTGETDLHRVKVGLLVSFCQKTGVSLDWLLFGHGEMRPKTQQPEHPLVTEARHIVHDLPHIADQAQRVLVAMESLPPWPAH